jgi:hypothetical protein
MLPHSFIPKSKLAAALILMGIFGQLFGDTPEERKVKIQKLEATAPSQESIERKERSHKVLGEKKVPINKTLPYIEDSSAAKLRSPQEIAERLLGCTVTAVGGEMGDKKFVDDLITRFAAKNFLTPAEKKFLNESLGDQQERVQFSWRYERSWVLLWALGYVDELTYPSSICDMRQLVELTKGKKVESLLAGAKPRSEKEILDAADLIYRLDWAVVDARVNNKPAPAGLDGGVVVERHAALNWLIGYMGQSWDEITTDT